MKHISNFKKSITLLIILGFSIFTVSAKEYKPDFVFPKTVINHADSTLAIAMQNGNSNEIIMSLIQYSLAESIISQESMPHIANRIDSIANIEKNPATKAILYSIEAQIYSDLYGINSYKIRERKENTDTVPRDITEWTTTNYYNKVISLINNSLANSKILQEIPVSKYKGVIEYNKIGEIFRPTLYDFIAYRSIEMVSQFDSEHPIIIRHSDKMQSSLCAQFSTNIINNLLAFHKDNLAACINTELFFFENSKREFADYKKLYEKYKGSQYSGQILIAMNYMIFNRNPQINKKYYTILNEFAKTYPNYIQIDNINDLINNLKRPNARIEVKSMFASTDSIRVTCSTTNLSTFSVSIYRVPNNIDKYSIWKTPLSKLKLIATKNITKATGAIPYSDTTIIAFPPLDYGMYVVLPNYIYNGANVLISQQKEQIYNSTFSVSDLQLIGIDYPNSQNGIITVNGKTGNPIGNVNLTAKNSTKSWVTDKNGIFKLPDNLKGSISGTKGSDIFAERVWIYGHSETRNETNYQSNIFTDLGVYIPGDTVKFIAVCYWYDSDKKHTADNHQFSVKLRDTNYQIIDSVALKSDNFGRIASSFLIPRTGLNGEYSISVLENNKQISNKRISVSEYKAPTFYIQFNDLKTKYARNQDIDITGLVKSYSQVPISNANINCMITQSSWSPFQYGSNEEEIASFTVNTDNAGKFKISIPKSTFDNDSQSYYIYNIKISATSASGETQENSGYFHIGNARWINLDSNVSIDASKSTKLPVKIYTSEPSDTALLCSYTLLSTDNKFTKEATFNSSSPIANLANIPSGEYKLTISIIGDTTTKANTENIIIYRPTDTKSPIESAMWIPETTVTCDKHSVASILIGNSTDTSSIYYIAYSGNTVIDKGWVTYNAGMHKFDVKIPESMATTTANILFITTHDFNTIEKNISIKPFESAESIKLVMNSFRDKIVPNSIERWSFKLINNHNIPVQGSVIAEMFDKSLNAIVENNWMLNTDSYSPNYCNASYARYHNNTFTLFVRNKTNTYNIIYPELNTYNKNFFNNHAMKSYSYFGNVATIAYGTVKGRKAESYDRATDMVGAVPSNSNKMSVKGGAPKPIEIQYRIKDVKCALWAPMLSTDKDGNVSIEFNVPNENTTWLFQAIAYNSNLSTTKFEKDIIANKPIMVQPNMPRFLRYGDKAILKSQVLNSSDSVQNCTVTIELFNPETKDIVLSQSFKSTIPATGTETFAIEYTVPDSIIFIGYRIKAATTTFGDGEQSLIAILPATSPVVESTSFFLEQNTNHFTLNLPTYPDNSHITLEYCDNPVWDCVTALPSIQSQNAITATGMVNNLFCNLIAKGIVTKYPLIEKALEYWSNNPKDSVLVSMLAKNESLKNVELSNTPWLNKAQKETVQMSKLATLFNNNNIDNASTKSITSLKYLQQSDGGWSWYNGCKSDQYTTYEIMQTLGELRQIGFLTETNEVKDMVIAGVKYLDKKAITNYNDRQDKSNYSGFLSYVCVRSFFNDIPLSTTLTLFKTEALKHIATNWRDLNITDKAFAAMALKENGYATAAESIVESLRQLSITKPATGMYWDNLSTGYYRYYNKIAITSLLLRTFYAVEPKSKDIDQIRKWLLLQKQTTNWGSSTMASDAIYSLLKSGSDWIDADANSTEISLNSTKIATDSIDAYTGCFQKVIDIIPGQKNSISITRKGNNPAWGSIFCQYNAPMKSIKSVSTDGLSIEKSLYIQSPTANGKATKATLLRVGDKVKVQFLIKTAKDLDFVNITDERCASIEPVNQLSDVDIQDGIMFYRELKSSSTNLYFAHIPKGTHIVSYDVYVTAEGVYSLGIATIQCQYAPQFVAHSAGSTITVK